MQFWYDFLYRFLRIVMFFWHPVLRVYGHENIPQGGCLLASNHAGASDPVWILLALRNPCMIRIIAKQELRRIPVLGKIMEAFRIIFVKRGEHDVQAYKQCIKALSDDEKLLVFIEGTRCSHGKQVRAKTGAIRMAQLGGKPIVPLYVTRNKKFLAPICVHFGKPYEPGLPDDPDNALLHRKADELLYQIYQMGGDSYADDIGKNCGLLLRS